LPSGEAIPGVISVEVETVLNSRFFVALIETYLGAEIARGFTAIQLGRKATKQDGFVIHLTQSGNTTFLNYCPKTKELQATMARVVPVLRSLLPFIPRSILVKRDNPRLAVEIFSTGSGQYETAIHFFDDDKTPVAYHLTAPVLDFMATRQNDMARTVPVYRFAMTAECLMYHTANGRQVDMDLETPDTRPTLKHVFDEQGPSHLVLLVDRGVAAITGGTQLPWAGPAASGPAGFADYGDVVAVARDVVASHGTAALTADFWVIMLNGGFLKVAKGAIPEQLRGECSSTNGKDIKCNFHDFRSAFSRYKVGVTEPVEVQELTSVPAKRGAAVVKGKDKFLESFATRLAGRLHVEKTDIQAQFMGDHAFCVRVNGQRGDGARHPLPAGPLDRSYQPCALDNVVKGCVDPETNVTSVVHCPCVGFTINHTQMQGMTQAQFSGQIEKLVTRYGFFVSLVGLYEAARDDKTGKLGEGVIEVCDVVAAVALARDIRTLIPLDATFNPDQMLTTTRAARAQGIERRGKPGGPPPPRINQVMDAVHEIPERVMGNIQAMLQRRAQATGNSRWRLDENYGVLIVPADEDAELQELLLKIQREDGRRFCYYKCPEGASEEDLVPEPLYLYNKDKTFEVLGVCRPCVLATLQETVAGFFNPNTRLINREKMGMIPLKLEPIPSEPSEADGDQSWPSVPLGAAIWTYMSDKRTLAPYVRAWVTGCAEFAVNAAKHLVTSCPDHPLFVRRTPKPGESLKCNHCDMMLCSLCSTWHKMDKACNMESVPGSKRCPMCKVPVFKTEGCNHITCRCGCHWCYVCQAGFDSKGPVYDHMTAAHGGWFVPVRL
jgi:hypothetical protein